MRGSLRGALLTLILPLAISCFAFALLEGAGLWELRRDLAAFERQSAASIQAERAGRTLEALERYALEALDEHPGAAERLAAAREEFSADLAQLRGLGLSRPGEDGTRKPLAPSLVEAEQEVDRYLDRARDLAARGMLREARRLIADDLVVLADARVLGPLEPWMLGETSRLRDLGLPLIRASDHWLVRRSEAGDVVNALLRSSFEGATAARVVRLVERELTLTRRSLLADEQLATTATASSRDQIETALHQLARWRTSSTAAATEDPAAIYATFRATRERALAHAADAERAEASAALASALALFEDSLRPTLATITRASREDVADRTASIRTKAAALLLLAWGVAFGSVVAGVASPIWIANRITRPIASLTRNVRGLRNGNWLSDVNAGRADELGELFLSLRDLSTELEESSRKVQSLSYYDTITGLPNRQLFQERLQQALLSAQLSGKTVGLLSLQLGALEQVNGSFGHDVGDELLRLIAERIAHCVRLTDVVARPEPEDAGAEVSRLGGGDFSILLAGVKDAPDAGKVAQRTLLELSRPFTIQGRELFADASIGISLYPVDGDDANMLLSNAYNAARFARERGEGQYRFYCEAMNATNSRRLHIASRLRGAMERGELEPHFQPLRDAQSSRVTGAEVLLRWTDSEMGPVPPSEFVPIAEEVGLIEAIGTWVLSAACEQAAAWRDAGFRPVRMAVNVSPHQLRSESWIETVEGILEQTGMSADLLELEITEGALIQDDAVTHAVLSALDEMGISIALDDFGTGYSSLSYLQRFPVSRVKIDRSFVAEISPSGEEMPIIGAILAMAKSLRLEVVAEGIETIEQAEFVRRGGCQELQGYLISPAVSATDFTRFLQLDKPDDEV